MPQPPLLMSSDKVERSTPAGKHMGGAWRAIRYDRLRLRADSYDESTERLWRGTARSN
jgi:hypothetical protein